MTFLTPMLAGIAAAIAVPTLIILYFLKLRRRDLEISTTLLWKKSIQDLQANAPFQKLRRNILLILQLLVLTAALFALAQPEFRAETATGKRSIILIDRSASMAAIDGDPEDKAANVSRLEVAKRQAVSFVDALREPGIFDDKADMAMVISFDTTAAVVQNFTSDKRLLKAAIESVEPSDAPTSIDQAFKLAKAYTGTRKFEDQIQENVGFVPMGEGAVIHLYSDGRIPDAESVATGVDDKVIYHVIGQPESANVGITALQVQRAFNDPSKLSIFVSLQNTARERRMVDVQVAIDEQIVKVISTPIPAATAPQDAATAEDEEKIDIKDNPAAADWKPGISGAEIKVDRVEGGVVTVQLRTSETDMLATDNVAYLAFPPAKRLAVALVTEGNFFLPEALGELGFSKLEVVKPADFQRRLDAGQMNAFDCYVFDQWLPNVKRTVTNEKGERSEVVDPGLPIGRSLVLGAVPPAPLGMVDDGQGDVAVIVNWQRNHRALVNAALDTLDISRSHKVSVVPNTPVTVIASTQDGPAILEIADAAVRAIVVPFNPLDSDWAFEPGFLMFLAESINYLTDVGVVAGMIRPGTMLGERLPQGARDVRLALPDRERIELVPAADGSVAYGPVRKIGLYTVSWEGPAGATDQVVEGRARRVMASNLMDGEESDIGARKAVAMAREVVESKDDGSEQQRKRLWPYLILAALGVIMLEWFVYNKKVHV